MGKPVTIDSDDVEVLLNAAAAIRHVESALEAVKNDPAMNRIYKSGKIGQALDRCNRARAQAIKEDWSQTPLSDVVLSTFSENLLYLLAMAGPMGKRCETTDTGVLRSEGLVVAGQCNEHVIWGDKTEASDVLPHQRIKITARGIAWLKMHSGDERMRALPSQPKEITHG